MLERANFVFERPTAMPFWHKRHLNSSSNRPRQRWQVPRKVQAMDRQLPHVLALDPQLDTLMVANASRGQDLSSAVPCVRQR